MQGKTRQRGVAQQIPQRALHAEQGTRLRTGGGGFLRFMRRQSKGGSAPCVSYFTYEKGRTGSLIFDNGIKFRLITTTASSDKKTSGRAGGCKKKTRGLFTFEIFGKPALLHAFFLFKQLFYAPQTRKAQYADHTGPRRIFYI